MKSIFWLVGDKSGDLHASKVIEKFRHIIPNVKHIGIGGPLMQEQGLKVLFPFEKFCVMGFAEVIKHLPFFWKVESTIRKYLKKEMPDLVILVDYPGLNLRVAKIAFDLKIKILYYICPQFWAWKQKRILKMKQYCDKIACIIPFEKDLLAEQGIESVYVGHPVVEEIEYKLNSKEFSMYYGLNTESKWISFFPGSRMNEIQRLLPIYLNAIKKLKQLRPEYRFLISKSSSVPDKLFMSYITDQDDISIVDGYTYEMMKYSDFMIVKSGTTTIESASIGTPFAIVYIANKLSYYFAKKMVKVKYIGMPNLILDKKVITELIQDEVTADKLVETILFYMDNEKEYEQLKNALVDFQKHLGQESASTNTTDIIIKMLTE
jgi:lipid-A-disaccharide synthase